MRVISPSVTCARHGVRPAAESGPISRRPDFAQIVCPVSFGVKKTPSIEQLVRNRRWTPRHSAQYVFAPPPTENPQMNRALPYLLLLAACDNKSSSPDAAAADLSAVIDAAAPDLSSSSKPDLRASR